MERHTRTCIVNGAPKTLPGLEWLGWEAEETAAGFCRSPPFDSDSFRLLSGGSGGKAFSDVDDAGSSAAGRRVAICQGVMEENGENKRI